MIIREEYWNDNNTFTNACMTSPTWQMINNICEENGYKFNHYARIDIDKNGKKTLEDISIHPINPDVSPEVEIDVNNMKYIITPARITSDLNVDQFETFVEHQQALLNLINELSQVDFSELYENYTEE